MYRRVYRIRLYLPILLTTLKLD